MGIRLRSSPAPALAALGLAALLGPAASRAGVEIDGRLPGTSPEVLVGPDFEIAAEQGLQSGPNLFHSFRVFGLAADESATFLAPLDGSPIDRVVATVSGGEASLIDGALRSLIPGADLYFVNPNGVLFGAGATLDVAGSFIASSADLLRLTDGAEVRPALPEASTFSMAPIEAFGFLEAPAPLEVAGGNLSVGRGRGIAFIGGDLDFHDGAIVSAPGGPIHLASLASAGWVELDPGGVPGLEVTADALGEIRIREGAVVNSSGLPPDRLFSCFLAASGCVPASGSGDIFIRGGELVIEDADVRAFTVTHADAGDVEIVLSGNLVIDQTGPLTAGIVAGSGLVVNPALEEGTKLVAQPLIPEEGTRPEIEIIVPEGTSLSQCTPSTCRISFAGSGTFLPPPFKPRIPLGAAGDVRVSANDVQLVGGGKISTTSFFDGPAGSVALEARGDVLLAGAPERFAGDFDEIRGGIFSNGQGGDDAGVISVEARNLELRDFGVILTEARGGEGRGGSIEVSAETVRIEGNARIDSSTRGAGDGGDIDVRAGQWIEIAGALSEDEFSGITSDSQPESTGSAGDLRVEAPSIRLSDGARISTLSTGGAGDAGTIDVRFSDTLELVGSAITARAEGAFGGSIFLNGGPLTRLPDGSLQVDKPPDLTSTGELLHLVDSEISTSVSSGVGEGGNIAIDPRFVVLQRSRIIADADESDAGNIRIVASALLADEGSLVRASSNLSADGVVELLVPEQDTLRPAPALPSDFLDAAALLREHCAARRPGEGGSFVLAGRDGLPASPEDYLSAPVPLPALPSTETEVSARVPRDAATDDPIGLRLGCPI